MKIDEMRKRINKADSISQRISKIKEGLSAGFYEKHQLPEGSIEILNKMAQEEIKMLEEKIKGLEND